MRLLRFKEVLSPAELEFADFHASYKEASYAFYGVPFDATSTHRRGSHIAPRKIREESYGFETYVLEADVDISPIGMCDLGNITTGNSLAAQTALIDKIYRVSTAILKDKKVALMAGGDHSITPPAVDSFASRHPNCFYIVLDAHLDFRTTYDDNPLSHACTSKRVADILGEENMAVLGVRSMSMKEREDAKANNLKYVTSWEIRERGLTTLLTELIDQEKLTKRAIYLSVDMDVIDPAYAPGVSNPEPWGLMPWDVLEVIRLLAPRIVMMDITEVNPSFDQGNTSALAARLFRLFVAYHFKSVINR
ncbi:MAG TPA: agmatinase [Euryarchaeota archaeon]|nr:MAG: agmatinase [Thermoplasmata archaeon]HDD60620.1 agmatinase [Euryarchaeota archaeon]